VKLFAGIDWARELHEVCVLDAAGQVVERRRFQHGGAGLEALCEWLLELAKGDTERVGVAIEVPRGAVVETLLGRDFTVYEVNPKQLDRFRDRFTMAGSKDDRLDAQVLADALRTDVARLRRVELESASVIELRGWTRMRQELVEQRVKACNRFRDELWRYYPQMSKLTDDVSDLWFLALWELAPTPAAASRLRKQSVQHVLRRYKIRRLDAPSVIATLREPPVKVAPGTTEAAVAHIQALVAQLRLLNQQIKTAELKMELLLEAIDEADSSTRGGPSDVDLLRSLPGAGKVVLATQVAEASRAVRAGDYQAWRALAAVAPVTRRSGQSRVVSMRRACNPRLRDVMRHWAMNAVNNDLACKASYARLRARGHSHDRALRGVMDRLLKVACAVLRDRVPYDAHRRLPTAGAAA
jgi:transposase